MDKNTVMLVLCRRVIAGLLVEAIQKRIDMEVFGLYEYNKAKNMAELRKPKIALVEIPERHGFPVQYVLDVCKDIQEASPGCKIILICPENNEESVEATLKAKKEGEIDDFLFYDLSVDYLVAKLETLVPQ